MKYEKMKELHDMVTSWCLINDVPNQFLLNYFMGGILAILEINNISSEDFEKFFNEAKKAYQVRERK
jgi:hypothetical protein